MVGRQDFELSIELYLNKIKSILSQLWKQAQIQPNQVDRIILVGGSSRIPCIRQLLIEIIGSDKIYQHPKPDLCVAEGAAIYAAYLEGLDVFGNREVEILTDGFNANISILNEKLEELHQQVSSLELQLANKKNEVEKLEAALKKIKTSKDTKFPSGSSTKPSQVQQVQLRVNQLVEGKVIKILKSSDTEKEFAVLIKGNFHGLQFTGFLHISEISDGFVDSISDRFKIGQAIKSVVLKIKSNNKIDVSTKVLEKYPGEMLKDIDEVMSQAEERLPEA
jgi:predicted RNA-binding protein with RPS1 domain